jgi:hypothetical protein
LRLLALQVFSSIKCDLPQIHDVDYSAFSEQEYTIFGTVGPNVKALILDGESIQIAPVTYTWSKKVKAPNIKAISNVIHTIQYFGQGTNPHELASGSSYIRIIVNPICD